MNEPEYVLAGGNVSRSVVRVGETVRKPATEATQAVADFLGFLERQGYSASPRHLGFDEQGRQVVEYVPGSIVQGTAPLTLPELREVGALLRELHDLSLQYGLPVGAQWQIAVVPDREELICHNDPAPWNLVRGAGRQVFIDWDSAGPGSRMWDLAYAAISFPPVEPKGDLERIKPRMAALVDGYA